MYSDTLNPHSLLFPGMQDCQPALRPERVIFPFSGLLSVVCVLGKLAAVPDGHSGVFVAAQGLLAWVVGEDDARGAQAADQVRSPRGSRHSCEAPSGTGPGRPGPVHEGWRWRPGAGGSDLHGRRCSSAGPARGGWRWCSRDGTGRRACHWTRLTPACARTLAGRCSGGWPGSPPPCAAAIARQSGAGCGVGRPPTGTGFRRRSGRG